MNKDMSILNLGDVNYFSNVFKKIETDKILNIVYLGGSITMGCAASCEENRYVNISAKWWNKKFPDAEINFFNAGIGATTSEFGCARACEHVLDKNPDLVFVEFSVNDDNTPFFMETYESLIRILLKHPSVKAVALISNLFYDTGRNAQGIHFNTAMNYDLPMISVRNYIYPQIISGEINTADYTDDMLHPKDIGHKTIAELIENLLEREYEYYNKADIKEPVKPALNDKFTDSRYENYKRLQNHNCSPICQGFTKDTHIEEKFSNPFKNGWLGHKKGDKIIFEIDSPVISIQWKRTINKPAPMAYAQIDNGKKILLDANFEENWGDLCCLTTLADDLPKGKHTLTIEIISEGKKDNDFMLISVLTF